MFHNDRTSHNSCTGHTSAVSSRVETISIIIINNIMFLEPTDRRCPHPYRLQLSTYLWVFIASPWISHQYLASLFLYLLLVPNILTSLKQFLKTMHFTWIFTFLTFAKMCIDAHVSCCSGKTLVLSIRYVRLSFGINELFGKPEVNDMYDIVLFARSSSHKEVLWFDVAEDKMFRVNVFNSADLRQNTNNSTVNKLRASRTKWLVYAWKTN